MTSLSTKFQINHFFLDYFRIAVQGQWVRQRRETLLLLFLNNLFRNQGVSPRDMTGSSFYPSFILALFVHCSSPQGPALWDPFLVSFPMRWVDFPAQLKSGLFTWLALANKLWADMTPGTCEQKVYEPSWGSPSPFTTQEQHPRHRSTLGPRMKQTLGTRWQETQRQHVSYVRD